MSFLNELRTMSLEEMKKASADLKVDIMKLRFQKSTGQKDVPLHRMKALRRRLAQALTVRAEFLRQQQESSL